MTTNSNPVAQATSGKAVNTLIKTALAAYGNGREKVQLAAIAIIEHAKTYNDCDRAKVLVRGLSLRDRNMLVGYFALYSPIGVAVGKTAAEDASRFIKPTSKNYHDYDIDGAKANKWYDDPAQVDTDVPVLNTLMDFYGIIDKMLKAAIATQDKYTPEDGPRVKEEAEALRGVVGKFRASQLAAINASTSSTVEKKDNVTAIVAENVSADPAAAMSAAAA